MMQEVSSLGVPVVAGTFAGGEGVCFTRVMECVAEAPFAVLLSLVGCAEFTVGKQMCVCVVCGVVACLSCCVKKL